MSHALILLGPPYAHHQRLLDWLCYKYNFIRFDLPTQIQHEKDTDSSLWQEIQISIQGQTGFTQAQVKALLWNALEQNISNRILFNNFPLIGDQLGHLDEMLTLFKFKSRKTVYCSLPHPEIMAEAMAADSGPIDEILLMERVMEAILRFEDKTRPMRRILEKENACYNLDAQQTWDAVETEMSKWMTDWLGEATE